MNLPKVIRWSVGISVALITSEVVNMSLKWINLGW